MQVPDRQRHVAYWLLLLCGLVFLMVVLGGFTRLTGSGLSMVDWRPLMGWLPPLTDDAWQQVFAAYRETPESQLVNADYALADFKRIFWLEYLHRLLGRLLGVAFLVPFVYFIARGVIRRGEWLKYAVMFVLGGMQGVLGWYMVKSGLVDVPRVSQYRLTAHLVAAFAIFAYMLWVALSILFPATSDERHPLFRRALALAGLVTLTIVSGGFVAGMKAGKIYNTFPLMGEHLVPPELLALEPWWRNLTENMSTVQFDHRVLAIATLLAVVAWWVGVRRQPPGAVTRRTEIASKAMLHTAFLQVVLGISTLLLAVPLVLAAAHQAVGMLLFATAVVLVHSLRRT